MTTPTIIDVPESSCAATVTMTLTRVVARTVSPFTLEEQTLLWPGEQWSIDFDLPTIVDREIANEWKAFAVALKGSYNYFLMGDSSAKEPLGTALGAGVLSVAGETGNIVNTNGWVANQTNLFKAGDYVQIGVGINSRLHMVVEPTSSDSSGNAVLTVEPAVRSATVINTPVLTDNPRGLFRLAGNSFTWSVNPGPSYRLSFSAVEVISA